MKINIVTEPAAGWVLRRLSESWARYIPNCSVSAEADSRADINFYVNYALFERKTSIDIALFTHRERDERSEKFDEVAREIDWCVAMCEKTAALLPKEKTSVIYVAPDPQFQKEKVVFGVVAREYASSNRKRVHWMDELKKIEGIEIRFTGGKILWEDMPEFYKSIDYLLILSDNEGGPVPLLEALAMGVPVISSDVGFAGEFTTFRYESFEDLVKLIKGLIIPKNAWEISSRNLEEVFKKVLEIKSIK